MNRTWSCSRGIGIDFVQCVAGRLLKACATYLTMVLDVTSDTLPWHDGNGVSNKMPNVVGSPLHAYELNGADSRGNPSQCASNSPLPSVCLFSTAVATIAIASLFKHEVLWRDAPHGSAGTSTDVICYALSWQMLAWLTSDHR